MLKKNSIMFGFALAMLVTAAIFGVLYLLVHVAIAQATGRTFLSISTLLIIALGVNLFILNYYTKYGAYLTGRGIMFFVMIFAAYIIYRFFAADMQF